MADNYYFFHGAQDWASQWHPLFFVIDGIEYSSCEQYMMAQKAILFKDKSIRKQIMATRMPRKQKALGRKIKNFSERKWHTVREKIVYNGNYAKFSQNPALKKQLLDTGDAIIVEASLYDKIWGVGMSVRNKNIRDPTKWNGLNLLGKAIMRVRQELA